MKIKIVTDSICDLPIEVVKEFDISVVPVYINIENQSYLDGIELSRTEYYTRLPDYSVPPTTSAPPRSFVKAKIRLRVKARCLISIHVMKYFHDHQCARVAPTC